MTDLRSPVRSGVRQEAGDAEETRHEERGGGGLHQAPGHRHHQRPQPYQSRRVVVQLPQQGGRADSEDPETADSG